MRSSHYTRADAPCGPPASVGGSHALLHEDVNEDRLQLHLRNTPAKPQRHNTPLNRKKLWATTVRAPRSSPTPSGRR